MWSSKDVYYISDGTGILATNLGQSLICQFPEINFHEEKFPFIKSSTDAKKTLNYILKNSGGRKPLIFSTLVSKDLSRIFDTPEVEFFDVINEFLGRLETSLEVKALRVSGYSQHSDDISIAKRASAINYCLEHDDGTKLEEYDEADVILLGVSRAGKTPASVYLATHMGLKSANFPLTENDLNNYRLPESIIVNRKKAVGLTTTADILHNFRQKRYPNSNYAKRITCIDELQQAQQIFQKYQIPVIETSGRSIEELTTQISQELGICKKTSLLTRQ
jgi:regulator of PEP synthase PpsR (kinase-PPPase family)